MTTQLTSLKELQKLDVDIATARILVATFDPQIEVIEEPALALESEVTRLRGRLQEVELDERRVELSADEKRARSKKLDERLTAVRNVREEAAVHAEIDMVRRSLEGAEQEALTLLDQIRRMEERLQESQEALEIAQAEVEPKRDELVKQREAAETQLAELESRREAFASGIDSRERDTYERILAGGRTVAVADLMEDGACGNCFSVIPLQLQNQILHGDAMIRCEGCGVILTPPAAEGSPAG
ncbi:MAG: zinc ribbon domain-containing protein [Longimicrobiales bacterium]